MKNIHQKVSIIFLLSVVFFTCCKEDCDDPSNKQCPNYDPCFSIQAADASFVMLDSVITGWADSSLSVVINATYTGNTVYFRALEGMESYEWKVGTNPTVITRRAFELGFDSFEGIITVRLVTTAKDDEGCLSLAKLQDTSYQILEVVKYAPYTFPIYGDYRGTDTSDPEREYTFTVLGEGEDLWHSSRLFNLAVPCDYPIGIRMQGGHNWFVSYHPDIHCRKTIAIGKLEEDNNTLIMDFWYDGDEGKREHYIFEGVRL